MAGFSNPIIGGGGALVYPSIHSPGFIHGSAGWSINKDGSLEANNAVIRNGQVISGTSLYYSGATPAAGTLIASESATGGIDNAGNAYLGGGWAAYNLTGTNNFAVLMAAGGFTFYHSTALAGPWVAGPDIAYDGVSTMELNGTKFTIGGALTATAGTQGSPTLITTDTWNTITMDAGWTVQSGHPAPQYRLQADGSVAFIGGATHASFTSALALNSGAMLPAALHAANFQYSPGDGNSAGCEFNTGGVLIAEPASGGSTILSLDGRIFWPGK